MPNGRPPTDRAGAVCIVRDAVDLAPFTIGHYLRLGFDRVHVIDDASSDGTYELLQAIAKREPRLVVERSPAQEFAQRTLISDRANRLIDDGIRIVFPFDIDEFWRIDLDAVRRDARNVERGVFRGLMVQFVQRRDAGSMSAREMLRVQYRAPRLVGARGDDDLALICRSLPKVAFKADGPVELLFGQHGLTVGPTEMIGSDLKVDHLPYRSRAHLEERAVTAARMLAVARPGECWHFAVIRDAVEAGRLEQLWAANSADDDGFLTAGGERIRLFPNGRMRAHLAKAWLYMMARHPRIMLGRPSASLSPALPSGKRDARA